MNALKYFKPALTVVTHNGSFHADEVFGCAALSLWAEKEGRRIKITRTRDPEIIKKADIVLDVGMEYNPSNNRFDHHQTGGAGTHPNGIPYASFGLIWKHFGEKITTKEVCRAIEEKLVIPVDARDNGINISSPTTNNLGLAEYRVGNMIAAFRPVNGNTEEFYRGFQEALSTARGILKGEIAFAEAIEAGGKQTLEEIEKQNHPSILILDSIIEWEHVASQAKEIQFVVYPDHNTTNWKVETPRDTLEDYSSGRAHFPESWRGLRDPELEAVSGITGAVFCHRGGWFAVAHSKEAGIEMAKKALDLSK